MTMWILAFRRVFAFALFLMSSGIAIAQCSDAPRQLDERKVKVFWQDDFARDLVDWGEVRFQFGRENISFVNYRDGPYSKALRVAYPKGSYDPGSAAKGVAPLGGAQFTAHLSHMNLPSVESVVLSYSVRFKNDFDFARGGKLPGLYGGIPRSGGMIPTGRDGFSTRIVWQAGGAGALYAYLPTSVAWGTLFGRGSWFFRAGKWVEVSQEVRLNTPGLDDGSVAIWIDRQLVHEACGVRFRDVDELRIDGVFFSTFFGGNDASWASSDDAYADFADFRVAVRRY